MKMKKILSAVCAAALILSITACGSSAQTDYSGETVSGKVTSVDGSTVTLQLGELTESDDNGPGGQGQPPEMPSGDGSDTGNSDNANGGPGSGDQPPEKPSGDDSNGSGSQSSDSQTPPAKPSGDSSTGGAPGASGSSSDSTNTPPEKPSGSADGNSSDSTNTPPEMPSGDGGTGGAPSGGAPGARPGEASFTAGDETAVVSLADAEITEDSQEASLSDIEEGDIIKVTFDDDNKAVTVEIMSDVSEGGSATADQGTSANTIDSDSEISDASYESTGDDENALRVTGSKVTLNGIKVNKSAGKSSSTENGDFYGANAALLATDGANVTIKKAEVSSSAQNGNGVFSYGSGTTVNISDSKITTTADNSGGIQTAGGGTTNASDLEIDTSGNSSAAIRSDRGGGTVNVDGGTYTSNGYNSPAVYSTADITVKNATLTANNSEALVLEGQNTLDLENCDVTGNMSDTQGTSSDENVHNVMIYQSMSGDAEEGTSEFSMTGGSLTSNNGDVFYVTNTKSTINLSGVNIVNNDADGYLMRICGNSGSHGWGSAGSNGADVEFTADSQTLTGNIIVDTISKLNMTLKNGSSFTGTINITDNADNGTAVDDNAVVTIEKGCTWTLTGDCTLTSLTNNGTINFNGHTITLADGTVLK